ncbi:MAG: hypothetical protein HC842_05385 [Cytophagales bacterium]|nr:hypothetical protein [Cytophagales bacterium]
MKKVVAIAMVFLMASSTFAGKFKMEDGLLYHDGELYTGEYKELFSNGKVASVFEFKQGIKDGEVVFYYDNGALKEKGLYKNGQKHDHLAALGRRR